jgi:hemolysin III
VSEPSTATDRTPRTAVVIPFARPAVPCTDSSWKPRLRGVSHQLAALAAVPAALALVLRAKEGAGRTGAIVYGASLVVLFATSAAYHRLTWRPAVRRIVARLDHSAIFVLIAGTYTPLCLLLGPGAGHRLLAAAWTGAAAGIALVVGFTRTPRGIRAGVYVLLGWFVLPVLGVLHAALGDSGLVLLFTGGFFYTAGAVIYALRRPDPFPRTFGYHEIFHALVIAAAACHFALVDAAVRATP